MQKIFIETLFDNNSYCYADTGRFENDGSYSEGEVIPALTKDKFVTLVNSIIEERVKGLVEASKTLIIDVDSEGELKAPVIEIVEAWEKLTSFHLMVKNKSYVNIRK